MGEITSTADIAEAEWDPNEESGDVRSDIVATTEPEGRGIEFNVSMRDYTLRDMEGLIIEAAAKQIVGRHNDHELAKAIEAKAIEMIDKRATAALAGVTAEIIDQPLTPTYAWSDKKPVTMREFLGLYGREYLTERVGHDGKPGTSSYGRDKTRMEWIAGQYMAKVFEDEIKKATTAAINEVRAAVTAQHVAFVEAEKLRFREALAATTAPAKK